MGIKFEISHWIFGTLKSLKILFAFVFQAVCSCKLIGMYCVNKNEEMLKKTLHFLKILMVDNKFINHNIGVSPAL